MPSFGSDGHATHQGTAPYLKQPQKLQRYARWTPKIRWGADACPVSSLLRCPQAIEGAEMIQEQRTIEEIAVREESPAYANGREDGRFGPMGTFLENPNLAGWADYVERLAYYRGHRDGRRAREKLAEG